MHRPNTRSASSLLAALTSTPLLTGLRTLAKPRPPRAAPGSTLLARAPQPLHGHWRVRCSPEAGGNPVRVIRVLDVDPTTPTVRAWCEWSNQHLDFALHHIETAAEVDSGRLLDPLTWWATLHQREAAEPPSPLRPTAWADTQNWLGHPHAASVS